MIYICGRAFLIEGEEILSGAARIGGDFFERKEKGVFFY